MARGEVVVFGSLNMDVAVTCDRHPDIGETVFGSSVQYSPGGKGLNQAVASARWGAWTRIIGAVGDDETGKTLIDFLLQERMQISQIVRTPGTVSGTALITVGQDGGNTIVVVPGANASAKTPDTLSNHTPPIGLSQFEVPLAEIEKFFGLIHRLGGRTILNPSPFKAVPKTLLAETDILIVNETELAQLTGAVEGVDEAHVRTVLEILNRPNQVVIVTLGGKGCLYCFDGEIQHFPAEKVDVKDTTGAGDCFAGIFAACLAVGMNYDSAASRANTGAALSTTRSGAAVSMPTREEVDVYIDRVYGLPGIASIGNAD